MASAGAPDEDRQGDSWEPKFESVHLLADDVETTPSVGEPTDGVDWRTLREGQVLICELDLWKHATRVARARSLAQG